MSTRLQHVRRPLLLPAIALLAGSLLVGRVGLTPIYAAGSLPACRYLDVLTAYRAPSDWQRTLVDTTFMVPATYVPGDLVSVSRAGIPGTGLVRELVIPDLAALAEAANAAGTPIAVQSAYRSYAYQVTTFQDSVNQLGEDAALLVSARPGHSEHQLGVAIDFRSADGGAPWESRDWATTPAGAWMKANAWEFGFVMSYPSAAARPTTCYAYEPWHYRYVGRQVAAAIHAARITTREYLWERAGNSVMAVRGSPTPTPSASPTAAPATATASPRATIQPAAASAPVTPAAPGPISPVGAALAVAIGLVILVAVEQLDRELRRRWLGRRWRRFSVTVAQRGGW